MGTFRTVSKLELRVRRKLTQDDLDLFEKFKAHLSRINGTDAVIYEFSNGEDKARSKGLLRKAAKSIGVRVRVIEDENSLTFYRISTRQRNKS